MGRGYLYFKMFAAGAVCCIGGPALMYYITPAEGEIFKKFNPELQKRNLETREAREKNMDEYLTKLKEYAKSDKSIWIAQAEAEAKERANLEAKLRDEQRQYHMDTSELQKRREEIRRHATGQN